ncbi:50S ribosomal protein L25/general stress protein Ctc [Gordonia alkaliphila]|uniref:50S ribosomal protein L25/general stress protein Ctc n=1 Tax=Gordonia alkaliphila TaxID=1053547 RepID=UPI001FF67A0D|nr:50S ribosomal protein L25/general stress protein Ctc [Gordonia alkaliphila]MCK0439769.1 50S ribosomal protein L25/general stress protein Ctc [Gordonia alkaliphila]
MSTQTAKLQTTTRTDTGKGAARRARREGQVPAVLYGHGSDPKHLLLPNLELAAILRASGVNAIIDLDIDGESQLALTRQVDVHPIKNYIQHVDLLIVRRGEKVIVEVPLVIEGETGPAGGLVVQDASVIEIEAEALHIPEHIVVSIEGLEPVSNVHAGDLELPAGVTLVSPADLLVTSVNEEKKSAEPAEGEGADAEAPAAEAAE